MSTFLFPRFSPFVVPCTNRDHRSYEKPRLCSPRRHQSSLTRFRHPLHHLRIRPHMGFAPPHPSPSRSAEVAAVRRYATTGRYAAPAQRLGEAGGLGADSASNRISTVAPRGGHRTYILDRLYVPRYVSRSSKIICGHMRSLTSGDLE